MINIAKTFDTLYSNEVTHRDIATITAAKTLGNYEAQTESGDNIIINGDANVGDKVFYDIRTRKILAKAPNVVFHDVPV